MRKHLSLVFVLSLLIATNSIFAQSNPQEKEVQQIVIKMFDELSKLDMQGIQKYTTKNFIVLESGVLWNMDTIAAKLEPLKKVSFSRTNHLDFIRTEINGNNAWVAYHNGADMAINGKQMSVQWLESAVLVKEKDGWKISMLHSTVVPKGN